MTDVREVMGFDVGDGVTKKAKSYYGPKMWDVVGIDLRTRQVELRCAGREGFVYETVAPRKLVLLRTAEERVADALMEKPQ